MAGIEAPGSYKDFLEQTESSAGPESLEQYSGLLVRNRIAKAPALGISLEDLHVRSATSLES